MTDPVAKPAIQLQKIVEFEFEKRKEIKFIRESKLSQRYKRK
jgi:hypothetical protein